MEGHPTNNDERIFVTTCLVDFFQREHSATFQQRPIPRASKIPARNLPRIEFRFRCAVRCAAAQSMPWSVSLFAAGRSVKLAASSLLSLQVLERPGFERVC